jgi:uncharacterized protein YuzE
MKIHYDADVDALYIEFHALVDGTAEARLLSDELIANYGPDGRLAGLEILDASQVLGQAEGRLVFEVTPRVGANCPTSIEGSSETTPYRLGRPISPVSLRLPRIVFQTKILLILTPNLRRLACRSPLQWLAKAAPAKRQ